MATLKEFPAAIPIFPLPNVVFFPKTVLPLHIFEPRYKEMIGECLAHSSVFGIVHAKQDEMAEIGCSAKILDVSKRYEDGRLDILTQGIRRFEVMRHWYDVDKIGFETFVSPDGLHMNDWSYACMAKGLGSAIAEAARRPVLSATAHPVP